MTPGDFKDVAISVAIAFFALKWAFASLSAHRKSDDKRTTKADDLIAAQLSKTTDYSREDYLRIEAKVEAFEAKIESKFETILMRLGALAQRDSALSVELAAWPAHVQKVNVIQHDVAKNRDGLNEARIKIGLPPIDQTPPFGIPIVTPSAYDTARHKKPKG